MKTTNILVAGFTGPSGSGKTTLAKWLAEQSTENIKMHYFEGSASLTHTQEQRDYLRDTYGYEPSGHQNVINLSTANPEFGFDFQRLLLEGRYERLKNAIEEIDATDKSILHVIVTDRTFIDIAVYSVLQCAHNISDDKIKPLVASAKKYQWEFFDLTFSVKPNEYWTEDNGSRVTSTAYQNFVVWPVVDNMVASFAIEHPYDTAHRLHMWDLDERKAYVTAALNEAAQQAQHATPVTNEFDAQGNGTV